MFTLICESHCIRRDWRYPDDTTITYDYLPSGKVQQRVNRRGWVTDYAYDDLYRMTTKTAYDDSEVEQAEETFTFDGLGRILRAQKTVSSIIINKITYSYNALSKVTDANEVVYSQAVQIGYAYDQAGFLIQIDCPDANQLITRDPLGRIDTLTVNDVEAVTYQYLGNRTARREYIVPDVDCDTDYNNLGQPIRVRTYGTTDITNFAYTYDAAGNIVTQQYDHRTNDPCSVFTYDNLDRLTRADYGIDTTNEQFTMDDIGNRSSVTLRNTTTETYVADPCTNAYTSVDGALLTHDASGNRTQDRDGYAYQYDYENRVVKITRDPAETVVAEFAYDALGRRMQRKDNIANETIRFYHDLNWQVLLEQDDSAVDQRWYIYGNDLDERLIMLAATEPYDHYYAHDHLGSSVALMEPNAAVEERYEYDAYGTVHFLNADYSTQATQSSNYDNPYLFTGRALDILDSVSLKLQHNRHRNYDAVTGRFTTVDPRGVVPGDYGGTFSAIDQYGDGGNLFQYVSSRGTRFIDPFGLWDSTSQPVIERLSHTVSGSFVYEKKIRHKFPAAFSDPMLPVPTETSHTVRRKVTWKARIDYGCLKARPCEPYVDDVEIIDWDIETFFSERLSFQGTSVKSKFHVSPRDQSHGIDCVYGGREQRVWVAARLHETVEAKHKPGLYGFRVDVGALAFGPVVALSPRVEFVFHCNCLGGPKDKPWPPQPVEM